MTYKDSNPTYNVNRKVVNFKDFNKDAEEAELKKMKRQNKPNSERQKLIGNPRAKYNKVTHKIDYLSPGYIEDKIDAIEESHIEEGVLEGIKNSVAYEKFAETLKVAIEEFKSDINNDKSIGFDEGDSDHYESLKTAIQEALNEGL